MSTIEGESTEPGSAGNEDHDSPSRSESIGNKHNESGSAEGSGDAELSAPVDTTESNPAEPLPDKESENAVSSSTDNIDEGEVLPVEPREGPEDSIPSPPVTVIESGALKHDSGEISESGTGSLTVKAANNGLAQDISVEEPGSHKQLSPVDETEEDPDDSAESSLSSSPEDSPPKAEIPVQVAGRRDRVTQEDMDRAIKDAQNNKDNEDKAHLKYPEIDYMIPGMPISPHRPRCVQPDQSDFGVPPPFVSNTIAEEHDEQPLAEAVETSLPRSTADDYPEAETGDGPEDNSDDNGRPQTPSRPVNDIDSDDPFSDFTSVAAAGNGAHEDADADPYTRPLSRAMSVVSKFSSESEEEDGEEHDEQEETKEGEPDPDSPDYIKEKMGIAFGQLEPAIMSPRGLGRKLSQRNLQLAREKLNEAGIDFLLKPGNSLRHPAWADEGELEPIFDKYLSEIVTGRRKLMENAKTIEEMKVIFPLYAEVKKRKASLDKQLEDANHNHAVEWNKLADESDIFRQKSELLQEDVDQLESELKNAREECKKLQRQTVINSAADPAQCDNCPRLQKEIDRLEAELLLLKSTAKSAPEGDADRSNKLAEDVKQLQQDLVRERTVIKELKDQQTFSLALSTFQEGVQWPREKRGAVAAIIVDYINSQNRDQEEPLEVEEVLDVLEQNLDIQGIARWLDRHPNRYRFKPYRLFQLILFSGEVLNLGLVAAFLSIPGYMDQGLVTHVPLRDYVDLFQTLREEWTAKYSRIREALDNADTERTSLLLELEDTQEQNTKLLMEATSQGKSAKADADMAKELAKAKEDLSDKTKELEGSGGVISDMSEQQAEDNTKIANLEAEKKVLESKVEQLTKDLKGKNNQATKKVGAVDTKHSESEERIKQLEDEAQRLQNTIDEFDAQAKESDKLRGELKALNEHINNISAQAAEASQLREEVDKLQKQNVHLNAKAQMDAKLIQEMKEAKNQPEAQQGSSGSGSDDPADKECPKKLARLTQDFEDLHEELDHEKQKANKKTELAEKWRTEKVDLETAHSKCVAQIADLEAKISELDAQRGGSSEKASSASEGTADSLPEKRLHEVQLDLSEAYIRIKELEAARNNLEQQKYQSDNGGSDDTTGQIEQYQQQISELQTIKDEHLKCPIIIAGLQKRISALEAIEAEHRRCSARISDLENNIHELEQELYNQFNESGTTASGLVDEQIQALQRQLKRAREEEKQAARAKQVIQDKDNARKLQDEISRLPVEAQRPQGHHLASALNQITELPNQLASANGEKDIMTQVLKSEGGIQKALSGRVGDLEATNRDLQATLDSTPAAGPANTDATPPANIAGALQKIAELENKLSSSSGEKESLLQMVNIATADKKALKEQVDDLQATNQDLRSNNTAPVPAAQANITNALQEIAVLKRDLANASGEKDTLLRMVTTATAGQKAFKERADELEATNRNLQSDNTATAPAPATSASLASTLQKIAELENNLLNASSEKDSLLQMVKTATAGQKAFKEHSDDLEATNRELEFPKTITADQNTQDQDIRKLKDNHEAETQRLLDVHNEEIQRLLDEGNPNDQSDADQDHSRTIKILKSQNERLNDENRGLHSDNARLEDEKKRLNTDNARLKDDNERLSTEIATASTSVKPNKNVTSLKTQIRNQATELARLDQSNKEMRNQLDALPVGPPDEIISLTDQVVKLQQKIDRLQSQATPETCLSRQLRARVTELETENTALEEWSGVSTIQGAHRPTPSSPVSEAGLRLELQRQNAQLRKQVDDLTTQNEALKDQADAAKPTPEAEKVDSFFDHPIDIDIGPDMDNIRAQAAELQAATDDFDKQLDRHASDEPHITTVYRNYKQRFQVESLQSQKVVLMALLRVALGVAEGHEVENDESENDKSKGNAESEGNTESEGTGQSEGSKETDSSESKLAKENAWLRVRCRKLIAEVGTALKRIPDRFEQNIPVLKDESEDIVARHTIDVYKKQADDCRKYYVLQESRIQMERFMWGILQRNLLQLNDAHEQELDEADATIADLQAELDATTDSQMSETDDTSEPRGTSKGKTKAKDESSAEDTPEEEQPDMCEKKLASAKSVIANLRRDLKVRETRLQSLGRERDNLLRLGGDEVKNALAKAKGGLASSLASARRTCTKTDDVPEHEQPETCKEKLALARSIARYLRIELRAAESQIRLFERGNASLLRIGGDSLRNALAAETGQPPKSDGTKGMDKTKDEGNPEETDTCERRLAFAQAAITDLRAQLKDAQARANEKTPNAPQPPEEVNGGVNGGSNGVVNGVPNGGINGGSNGYDPDWAEHLLQDQLDQARQPIKTLQKEMAATGDPEKSHISTYLAMANKARDQLRGAHQQIEKERHVIAGLRHDSSQQQHRHEKALSAINARIEQLERENAKLRRIGGEKVKTAVGAAAGTAVATGAAALTSAFGRPASPRANRRSGLPTPIPGRTGIPRPTNPSHSPSTSGHTSGITGPSAPRRRSNPPLPRPTSTSTPYLPLNHGTRIRPINRNSRAHLHARAEHDRKAEEMRQRHSDNADRQQRIDDYLLETWGIGRWRSREEVWAHIFKDGRRGGGSRGT